MIHTIKPKFGIMVYPFLYKDASNKNTDDTAKLLTDSEVKSFDTPIQLPMEFIESFSYTDGVEGGSFDLSIPNGFNKTMKTEKGIVRLSALLSIGHLVVIKEGIKDEIDKKDIKFTGYITSVNDSDNISGDVDMSIRGTGLEGVIQKQIVFVDFRKIDRKERQSKKYGEVKENDVKSPFQDAFNIISRSINKLTNASDVIKEVTKGCLDVFLSKGLFGNKKISTLMGNDTWNGLTYDTYTQGMTHIVSWMQNVNFGNSINWWNLIDDFSKAPLYELFFHYNSSQKLWIDDTKEIQLYSEKECLGHLVYRKCPFFYIDKQTRKDDSLVLKLDESKITSFDMDGSIDDVFTGISCTLGVIGKDKGTLVVPPRYNTDLVYKYGQRVLTITIDGIAYKDNKSATLIEKIKEIQDLVYNTFGKGDRIYVGNFDCDYFREATKGKILKIIPMDSKEKKLHKALDRYDSEYYLTGITVNVNPASGEAGMKLKVKWGRLKPV